MYLKSIRLDGFKSFADKTIFDLNKGITAIVGPNGSGKSNIVDAVRWVLGEQSVKSLRGASSMSDVIFSGSSNRNGLNKASVILTFNNSDKYLSSDFEEIEVKRSIYKSGESEYFINNTKVRLKDIQDLFIDSGSGIDSFNIISQGTVTDVVNSKPHERRVIFESAAGVLKYKKRKEESLRKLEKTKDNLNTVNLVINELETTINPLKEQAEVAKKYLELKEELKYNEIAITTRDITDINNEYKALKIKEEELTKKLDGMQKSTSTEKIEKLKFDLCKLDDTLAEKNKKILDLTEEISLLSSEKRITIERTKYEYSEDKIKNNLINLKEEELSLIKEIEVYNNEIDSINASIKEKETNINKTEIEYNDLISTHTYLNDDSKSLLKQKFALENRIDILENNILNNEKLPLSVKNILNNPRLNGIHDTIGNLIDIPEEYVLCTEVVLGAASNFIIVDNETSAKDAINYLKENKLGRATFFPINVLKPKKIDDETFEKIKEHKSFIDVASNLVQYNTKYETIVSNQLGNVIIVKDIDAMNEIGKLINYRYKIVTLSGEILNAGGSVTGGSEKRETGLISEKFELESLKLELVAEENKTKQHETEVNELDYNLKILENKLYQTKNRTNELNESLNRKNIDLKDLNSNLNNTIDEINGIANKQTNTLDKELESVLENFYELEKVKDLANSKLVKLKSEKDEIQTELSSIELETKKQISEYNSLNKEKNLKEIETNRIEVRLDNLLLKLNEDYKLTYDLAKHDYELELELDDARIKVNSLKNKIKALGEVNLGSISEYERVNERYTFLTTQANDLTESIENLLNVIKELDETMIDKFKNTFDRVNEEFKIVFKKLFRGGTGKLVLTDEENLLETGVEIIASPPAKNLKSLNMLSGGEKTLTAIALLFSILNIRIVPFCILDEVEAALDEANVDMFGTYLSEYKDKTQFIIITHKKRTMEYAKTLYGITMQESGVSKLVSVRLDEIN